MKQGQTSRPTPNNFQQVGVLTILLAYLEGDNIAKQIVNPVSPFTPMSMDIKTIGLPWHLPLANNPNFAVAQTKIKPFLCPSDTQFDANASRWCLVPLLQSGRVARIQHHCQRLSAVSQSCNSALGDLTEVWLRGSWHQRSHHFL